MKKYVLQHPLFVPFFPSSVEKGTLVWKRLKFSIAKQEKRRLPERSRGHYKLTKTDGTFGGI